ncbi:putative sterigmatocystin biosynthesis peroxidase stcC [Mycena sanguinolenta]|uniref:Putative sterigmatocystin biosynthesis peroxidase stcC n=1 Tax=Mycena sanguinolenta TaxID=230812 RepID=A0A8H6YHU2_9AGAR|nr:putative sterigmatocystin biosynthesis peroxidase stcC [Mycena sanguinolenta]
MLFSGAGTFVHNVYIFSWDALLAFYNVVTPNLKEGKVVPKGCPGAGGKWPPYVAPGEGDSRSACPALNAMANHGRFSSLSARRYTPTCLRIGIVLITTRTCDPGQDYKYDPDQGKPYLPYIEELLASASGKDKDGNVMLTPEDLSRYSSKRRTEARATNPEFTLDTFHKMFGSANSSTLLTIFGGRLADLEPILTEERIPEGWESRIRSRMGLTFMAFNRTVFKVEGGIKEGEGAVLAESQSREPLT